MTIGIGARIDRGGTCVPKSDPSFVAIERSAFVGSSCNVTNPTGGYVITQSAPQALSKGFSPKKAVLVVNGMSRRGHKAFDEAKRLLEAAGLKLDSARCSNSPDEYLQGIRSAIADGADLIILGGGDGSISSAIDDFVGQTAVVGILPLGTANSFARSLGIPLDLPGAVNTIVNGEPRTIDLGMINDDYFASCAALGMSPLIASTVPHRLKAVLGRIGYLLWAGYQFFRFRSFMITVGEGEDAVTLRALEVRIANGSYHGGHELVEDAVLDSGEIVVQVVEGRTKGRLALSWMLSILRLYRRNPTTRDFHGRSLKITTMPPLDISIDGEVAARTPVIARAAPAVIRVMEP